MSILGNIKKKINKTEEGIPDNPDVVVMRDTKKPLPERKEAFERMRTQMMNPKAEEEFDPETFDPLEDNPDTTLGKRERTAPPRRLPTMGMKPKAILEGQMVGMYETKQDLYLLIAALYERVADLEDERDASKEIPKERDKK